MIDQRSVILGLTTWFLDTQDELAKAYADRHVAALKRIARKERESWYYPASEYTEKGWPSFDAVVTRLCPDPCAMWGRQVNPLIRYYQHTGNNDALEFCENFAAIIVIAVVPSVRMAAGMPDLVIVTDISIHVWVLWPRWQDLPNIPMISSC
jgi:hypothetical protein